MPTRIEAPSPTLTQRSGKDPEGRFILSVLAKRTYRIEPPGRMVLDAEQLPLVVDPEVADPSSGRLAADIDLYPFKLGTDVVVKGHAYGRGRHQFDVSVRVDGKPVKVIRVIGDREVGSLGGSDILIAPPSPVDRVPLSYTHAYGGIDAAAVAKYGIPWGAFAEYTEPDEFDMGQLNPFRYPRNPAGRGYLMEPTTEAVNALVLPNLEDPSDLLTPDRLLVRQPGWWYKQPLPQASEWLSYGWFPRLAYFGVNHGTFGEPERVPEVERGFAPENILTRRAPTPADAFRFTSGASLGLQVPYLRGGEVISLENAHPRDSRYAVRLPGEVPGIWTDGRKGTLKETDPVIHTVVIEPDIDRVTVLWRGSAPALRPYLPQELEKMPLRVEWP